MSRRELGRIVARERLQGLLRGFADAVENAEQCVAEVADRDAMFADPRVVAHDGRAFGRRTLAGRRRA
jgi:hypothetical protein